MFVKSRCQFLSKVFIACNVSVGGLHSDEMCAFAAAFCRDCWKKKKAVATFSPWGACVSWWLPRSRVRASVRARRRPWPSLLGEVQLVDCDTDDSACYVVTHGLFGYVCRETRHVHRGQLRLHWKQGHVFDFARNSRARSRKCHCFKMIQRDSKKKQTWAKPSAKISRVMEEAD